MTATRRRDGSHRAAYGAHDGGRRRALALMVAVLLLAAFLRFHDLDAQSFWNDEGNSARIVERTPALIVEAAAGDIHPPLYYLLLAGWRLPAGFSAFALRSFSVMCGLFTVALTYALGRRLFDRTVGILGALVVALHAFQVYYSQEARMYALMAALAAGSMYAWVRWCAASAAPDAGGLNRWAVALVALNAAGLYTQYAYPVVMLAQAIAFAAWWLWRSRRRRMLAVFAGLLLASVALYLPWLAVEARQALGWPTTGADESLLEAVQRLVALLVYGIDLETWGLGRAIWAAGIPLIVAALPLVLPRAFEPPRGRALHAPGWRLALLWAWALLPVAGVFALGLYRPAFLKTLLIGHAPVALLVAWGLAALFRMSRPTALVALLCTAGLAAQLGVGLNHLYNDPAQARADYRAIAAHIAAVQRPGDAVLLNAANQWEVFTYYHRETGDNAPVYPIPRARPVDAAATRAELDAILAAHDRLFVLYWGDAESDPARVVESYLSERAAVVETTWYQDVRLVTYIDWTGATDAADALPAVRFHAPEGDIHLTGHMVRVLGLPAHPGDALAVTLRWEAETRLSGRYKVFVHLVDPDGAIVAQHDSEPAADLRPTDTWQPGETVTDNHGLQIPAGAAPGAYRVYVGLYPLDDPATRLPVTVGGEDAGDYLALATVAVE